MYYVYIVECMDESLYTGIAADLSRRLREHLKRGARCAKYTRTHPIKRLSAAWMLAEKGEALRVEAAIKTLPRQKKQQIIASPQEIKSLLPSLSEISLRACEPGLFQAAFSQTLAGKNAL